MQPAQAGIMDRQATRHRLGVFQNGLQGLDALDQLAEVDRLSWLIFGKCLEIDIAHGAAWGGQHGWLGTRWSRRFQGAKRSKPDAVQKAYARPGERRWLDRFRHGDCDQHDHPAEHLFEGLQLCARSPPQPLREAFRAHV